MPAITVAQLQELLKSPKNKERIKLANEHERRVSLHTRLEVTHKAPRTIPNGFFDFVRQLISEDKYYKFLSLLRVPFPTVGLSDKIWAALDKVFDGRDPVETIEFVNDSQKEDFLKYWEDSLGGRKKWRTKASQRARTAFNSIVVADLPDEVDPSQGIAPYYYFVDTAMLIDFEQGSDESFNWVMFATDSDKKVIAHYDSEYYTIFTVKSTEGEKTVLSLDRQVPHNLGYCPATLFWHDSLEGDSFIRRNPLTIKLGELDHLLKDITFERHLKLFSGNPIWAGFKLDCSYQDESNGYYCDSGFLREVISEEYAINQRTGGILRCPSCDKHKEFAGPGTYIEVDPPDIDNDKADLRNPISMLSPDVDILNFNIEDVDRQKNEIYADVTGNSMNVVDTTAINESQVKSLFEKSTNVLLHLKHNYERTESWLLKTLASLKSSTENVVNISVNYGTQFYLMQADVALSVYNQAKIDKVDPTILDTLLNQYYETKYRHNPEQLLRVKLLANIDPALHMSTSDAQLLFTQGILPRELYAVKANFSSYIKRFEREEAIITEFGKLLPFGDRVQAILDTIVTYVPKAPELPLTTGNTGTDDSASNNSLNQ